MQLDFEEKIINLSQIRQDLEEGLARWKKDDVGFGSIEKKYNLSTLEMAEIISHPKIRNIETRIRKFLLIDDLPDLTKLNELEVKPETVNLVKTTTIEVIKPQIEEKQREEVSYTAFI